MAIALLLLAGCAARSEPPLEADELGRHRAALASVTVVNETDLPLQIAFRTANPPIQEVVIGRVLPGQRAEMAPIPAGEPIIFVARRSDGAEFQARIQSFPLDGAVVWNIPKNATFAVPETRN
jgi:hypothetical protein